MPRSPAPSRRLRSWIASAVLTIGAGAVLAQDDSASANSPLDAPLFYQLLIGELELSAGRAGSAYEVMLDAARRHGDDALFRRTIEIALQARAGDQALAAARAWRVARPQVAEAMRFEVQILLALNRLDDLADPLQAWLAAVPDTERPMLIASLPRLLQRATDRARVLAITEPVLERYLTPPATRVASLVALARVQVNAGQNAAALERLRLAQAADPAAPGPALVALDMLPGTAAAEALVTQHLARPAAEPAVRLAYVRLLTQAQRYTDAAEQLEVLTRERPELAEPWLSLGALRLELKQLPEAEAALLRFVEIAQRGDARAEMRDEDDDNPVATADRATTQAWLLLAQVAEQRGDLKAAEQWLGRVDNPQRALEVQSRRASMLMRQGKVKEARALIHAVPERNGDDVRAKLLAEAQLLRDGKRWPDAAAVLAAANSRFADDVDLIYEQAMAEEKVERFAEMERLLRRVIELKPEHPHAHNALGYSLADRNQRLGEARDLIRKALDLSPGDPFITDSLGWVEYRLGNREEAARLLRQAYRARPDTEIATHLGEVLWVMGERDEARRIWQDARGRDADNELLRETLARLKVGL
ncbi:tetratricopeptide repeat protein [Aquincola sp. S2]|uniref:Tetratricopeptide repeat protein n=1 Tax=Pseudaquabacterium terrae TaxID=2732868 RepID=A0ABX2ETB3_9BURK|nr:tetratricopeptide repeat protein [Aquabacterium terrae]NRF71944.1 tetratricopeptide repeat protein [Aquabacterium terrae]